MKKKCVSSLRLLYMAVSVAILLTTAFCFSGCGSKKDESFVWLSLTVKFKENTSERVRDAALSAIRRIIIDSVRQVHMTHNEFDPKISTEQFTADSLMFGIKVENQTPVYMLTSCLCKTDCRICQTMNTAKVGPTPPGDPFELLNVLSIIPDSIRSANQLLKGK